MAKKPPKPPGKPQGDAIDWTDEEIDALAEITPEDIASAKAHFRRVAPKKVKRILDAEEDDGRDADATS